ncbi:hypothetical protein ACHAQA_001875 [Verticillium albo-atrum]
MAPQDRRPIVISGPSGVGKGTLIQKLTDTYPCTFASTVSHTTRQPRPGEVEGSAYFFVSRSDFSTLVSRDAFIEYTTFSDNSYGTSKQTVAEQEAKGLVVVLEIETEGVKQTKASPKIDARYIFIKPPSLAVLEARLRGRGTEKEEDVQKRLARARAQIAYADTPGVYDVIIVNGLRQLLSSRKKHLVVLALVGLDVAALLANIFIELVECDRRDDKPAAAWPVHAKQALTTAGLVFSSMFLLELLLCIAAFGLEYLSDWFHCLDALVIVASFVVDLLSHGIVEDIASLVIVFRLFRFVKMVEEVSMGAAERMEGMANELDKLRAENSLLKERLNV